MDKYVRNIVNSKEHVNTETEELSFITDKSGEWIEYDREYKSNKVIDNLIKVKNRDKHQKILYDIGQEVIEGKRKLEW